MECSYMGIDPGQKGGIAVITPEGNIVNVPMSDMNLKIMIGSFQGKPLKVVVEKVGAMPGQGVVSMFNFGKGFGYILGILDAYNAQYELVPPQKWKKEFSLNKDKGASINVCRRLFPEVNLKATERCRNDHDGMAESLLMAEYARRHMK